MRKSSYKDKGDVGKKKKERGAVWSCFKGKT